MRTTPRLTSWGCGDVCVDGGCARLSSLGRPVLASSKNGKRTAQIVLGHSPVERHTLARPFLQRLVIGSDSLFKLRSPALAPSKSGFLGPGPFEWHTLAGLFFQHLTIGSDGLFEF